jgi:hypothetical protein
MVALLFRFGFGCLWLCYCFVVVVAYDSLFVALLLLLLLKHFLLCILVHEPLEYGNERIEFIVVERLVFVLKKLVESVVETMCA